MADHIPHQVIRASFATEQSVYGVILVSGMIVVAGTHDSTSWEVFWTVVITVVVFWLAHVYAGTVAHHGLDHGRVLGIRESFREALAALMGTAGVGTDPVAHPAARGDGGRARLRGDLAGPVGGGARAGDPRLYRVRAGAARRGRSGLLGGLTTAAFGLVLMLMKALVH